MTDIICPFCEKASNLDIRTNETEYIGGIKYIWKIGRCPACNNRVLLKFTGEPFETLRGVWPTSVPKSVSNDVPESFKSDLNEANICHNMNCYRSTVMLCRRIARSICEDQGSANIKELETKGKITKTLAGFAEAIRLTGNTGEHEDNGQTKITPEDATATLEFTETLIDHIYVAPSRIEKHIQKFKK